MTLDYLQAAGRYVLLKSWSTDEKNLREYEELHGIPEQCAHDFRTRAVAVLGSRIAKSLCPLTERNATIDRFVVEIEDIDEVPR